MKKGRQFAAFDIDGTLIRWQLYHAIADQLIKEGYVDEGQHQKIKDARMAWKERQEGATFKAYERLLVDTYEASLKQLTPSKLNGAIDEVFDQYRDQVYTYTRSLIDELKGKNYLLFAISGSQAEIVARIAHHYGFDDYIGTVYEHKDDKFTGQKIIAAHNKNAALKKLVKKHFATFEGSLAIGDSASDASMLELVQNPIAFNPDAELLSIAKAQGWKIVVERKNVIYELEARDGTYLLA